MALLKPKQERKRTKLRTHTALRCPFNGHQASWCRSLCEPISGQGPCGRPAPHAVMGRTQVAIAAYMARTGRAA